MKVYHGTDAEHVDEILENGLKPRNATGRSNWDHNDMESIPNHVYLTDKYGPFFGLQATDNSEFAMFEVDLELLHDTDLYPDEDFVEQAMNKDFGIEGQDLIDENEPIEERTKQVREKIDVFQPYWEHSLDLMGNLSHRGTIPTEAISRVSIVDPPRQLRLTIDPAMSIKNAQIAGGKYEMYTRLLMGDEVSREEYRRHLLGIPIPEGKSLDDLFDESDKERLLASKDQSDEILNQDYITAYENPNYDG